MNTNGEPYKSAKEYLQQIEVLNKKINHRIREAERMHALITGGALTYNPDKIQTSVSRAQEERLERYIDMQLCADNIR